MQATWKVSCFCDYFPKDSKAHQALLESYNRSAHGNHRECEEGRSMSNSVHSTAAISKTPGTHGTIWAPMSFVGIRDLAQMEQNL